jgi:hypothetical protein
MIGCHFGKGFQPVMKYPGQAPSLIPAGGHATVKDSLFAVAPCNDCFLKSFTNNIPNWK